MWNYRYLSPCNVLALFLHYLRYDVVFLYRSNCQFSESRFATYPEKSLSSIIEREFLMPKKPGYYEELKQSELERESPERNQADEWLRESLSEIKRGLK